MRLIDADEYEKRIKPYDTEDVMDKALYNFAHGKLIETSTAEPRKGKWVRHNTYHGDDTSGFVDPDWRCSECGRQAIVNDWFLYDLTDFCPHCGARMEEPREEEQV